MKHLFRIVIFLDCFILSFGNAQSVSCLSGDLYCNRHSMADYSASHTLSANDALNALNQGMRFIDGIPLPHDFPEYQVHQYEDTAPGYIFTTIENYLLILKNDGTPYFYRRLQYPLFDLMLQPDSVLSYCEGFCTDARFILMDKHYHPFDTLTCGHGYDTGGHDFIGLPNGHTLFIGVSYVPIDMSTIIPDGIKDSYLEENSLIELDVNGKIVFEWHCQDHYDVRDVLPVFLTQRYIQYVHINSISVDYDGHLIISNRSFSDVTKINHETGEIIWRLGGVYNQFTFIKESKMISFQHSARPVPGKPNHYTVFDNGFMHEFPYSRVIEYKIDPDHMTAEKVWEYAPSPAIYSYSQGNAQRLSNRNTLINWGLYNKYPPIILLNEVNLEGDVVYEIIGYNTDRSFRFEWKGQLTAPYLMVETYYDHIRLLFNQFGADDIIQYRVYADTTPDPVTLIRTTHSPYAYLLPSDFIFNDRIYNLKIISVNEMGLESSSNIEKINVNFIDPSENMIYNGNFSKDTEAWELYTDDQVSAVGTIDGGQYHIRIQDGGMHISGVILCQKNIKLDQDKTYTLEFDAYATSHKSIEIRISDYYSFPQRLNTEPQHFSMIFTFDESDDYQCQLEFHCGGSNTDVYFDNIVLKQVKSTGVTASKDNIPMAFELSQNHPNPFNPSTTIRYSLLKPCEVRLSIFNIMGREIEILVRENQQAGSHEVTWHAEGFPCGIYYYRLKADGISKMRKMVLMK